VTFDANGGSGSMSPEAATASEALSANSFDMTGFAFTGWNTASGGSGTSYADGSIYSFTSNVTLYAQWSTNTYAVTFSSNGGAGTMPNETGAYDSSAPLTSNAFTRTGFTFVGWSATSSGAVAYADAASFVFSANVTLYAQWSTNTYAVTFSSNGGAGTMPNETGAYDSSAPLTSNSFTLADYTFTGWNTASDGSGTSYANDASYSFSGNVTLYAQWSIDTYTVTFDANGGSGSMSPETSGTPAALTSNTFTLAGFTFTGWNTAADGSGTSYANDASYSFSGNATLYAQWVSDNVAPTITQNPSSDLVYEGDTATFTAAATGTPAPTVQWMVSTNDVSWTDVAGATSTTYSVTSTLSVNGNYYEAVFTNAAGSVTSSPAQLTYMGYSSNWAGYIDTTGSFSGVSGQWVVPTVSCSTSGSQDAVQWVGIDGYGSSTVEQDGTVTACNGTTPTYGAWYEMFGDASVNDGEMVELSSSSYPVSPGDVMSAAVQYADGNWRLSVDDVTQGWTFSINYASPTPPPAQDSAEWIVETPDVCTSGCALASLPDFGTTTFTNASVTDNGTTGSITSTVNVASEAFGSGGDVLMSPGALNAEGTSFTVTWQASS
jgi:uncharacterized repeat protein (TIGR02543 family)